VEGKEWSVDDDEKSMAGIIRGEAFSRMMNEEAEKNIAKLFSLL
jgi:hypothetical protein